MGFFDRLYYGKAGQRDYSVMDQPKGRVSLFFMVLKDHFFDLVKVNALQLVFWLPFLCWTYINLAVLQSLDAETILAQDGGSSIFMGTLAGHFMMWIVGLVPCVAITGPSSAGAAYIMRNWARDQHAFLLSDFKDAFKGNWKQALGVSVLTSFVPAVTYTAVSYYGGMLNTSMLMIVPLIVVFSVALMWALMLPLMYPMMIGYELKFKDVVKNAFLMASARLPQMIAARIITLIPILGLLIALYMGSAIGIMIVSLYYLLFGFALSRLVYASFANGVFDRYLNPRIEGAEVRAGLRPQTDDEAMLAEIDAEIEAEEAFEDDEEE